MCANSNLSIMNIMTMKKLLISCFVYFIENRNNFIEMNDLNNKLVYEDLFKFCENILKFSSSDKAVSCLDGLVILQTFVQRLSKILFNYTDKS
jgi:hypothetical protein